MDVESPEHLERFRDHRGIMAVLLRMDPDPGYGEARFERSPANRAYWPPIIQLAESFQRAGQAADTSRAIEVYGQPCRLLAVRTAEAPTAPFAIAVVAGAAEPEEEVIGLLRAVCHDYWFGSTFFK